MKKIYALLFCVLTINMLNAQCTPTIVANSNTICSGATVTLTASGGTSYTWLPAAGNGQIAYVQPTATTIYTLLSSFGGCSSSATIQIDVYPSPSINVVAFSNTICATSATSLAASGAISYAWSPSESVSDSAAQSVSAFPNTTTTYTVTGYDGTCYGSAYVTLSVTPSPVVSFTIAADPTPQVWNIYPNCSGGMPPYNFSWYWGDGSSDLNIAYPSHTYSVAGTYNIFVNVTDANGCFGHYTVNANIFKTANSNEALNMIQVNVVNLITGIQTMETDNDIRIFPNPTSEKVYINHSTDTELSVEVLDVNGKLVISKKINADSYIDVSSLDNGVYTLTLKTGIGNPVNKKLTILR